MRFNWINDLEFLFEGDLLKGKTGWEEFDNNVPFFALSDAVDIALFFDRLGQLSLLEKHLVEMSKAPPAGIDEESAMIREFTCKVEGALSKCVYTVFGIIAYSQQGKFPVDAKILVAIAPPSMEALVRAQIKDAVRQFTAAARDDECVKVLA